MNLRKYFYQTVITVFWLVLSKNLKIKWHLDLLIKSLSMINLFYLLKTLVEYRLPEAEMKTSVKEEVGVQMSKLDYVQGRLTSTKTLQIEPSNYSSWVNGNYKNTNYEKIFFHKSNNNKKRVIKSYIIKSS